MINQKHLFSPLAIAAAFAVLTFAIPAVEWLLGRFAPLAPYSDLISNLIILLIAGLWCWKAKLFSLLPSTSFWKVFCALGMLLALGLLIINIRNAPVAKITGQARSPFEVLSVIIFSPIAEELIFRGIIWSILGRLSENRRWNIATVLVGSSLLFGVEHLGYWAQSYGSLPAEAFIHASSMVLAGICFGVFRQTSHSLAVPAVVHILANGLILLTQ